MRAAAATSLCAWVVLAIGACAGDIEAHGSDATVTSDAAVADGGRPTDASPDAPLDLGGPRTDSAAPPSDAGSDTSAPPPDDRAWLHADLWSTWWNDRTRCGAERTFLEICERRGDACDLERAALDACDPAQIVYGQVGPEQSGERLCQRGRYPDVGGCDARAYDFERLRFWWYGAEWQGNWPFATIKIFPAGTTDPMAWSGAGLVALSTLPGLAQSGMSGIDNHSLGDSHACVMRGYTSGDEAYRTPFGAFAWIEVPTDAPVTVVAAAATNFADHAFAGCSRGAATQDPWIAGAPGAELGCVYVVEHHFQPGHHYVMRYGRIEELAVAGPPEDIVAAFAWPEVGVDATAPCD